MNDLPLQNHLLMKTCNLDEMRALSNKCITPHRIQKTGLSSNSIDAVICQATLQHMSISYVRYGVGMKIGIDYLDSFLIEIPLTGSSETVIGSKIFRTKPGLATIVNPDRAFQTKLSGDCSKILVKIDKRALEQHLSVILGRRIDKYLEFKVNMDFNEPNGSQWWRTLNFVIDELDNSQSLLNKLPATLLQYEQILLWNLLHTQPNNYTDMIMNNNDVAIPYQISIVEEYIENHYSKIITLYDLVKVSKVSTRTLHETFKRYRNISPMKLLKLKRLQCANELLNDPGSSLTVTDIAMVCGFNKLSNFTQDYKQRFGETPSDSLKRHRPMCPIIRSKRNRRVNPGN